MCTVDDLKTRIKRKRSGLAQLKVNLLSPLLSEAERIVIQRNILQCIADIEDFEQQIDDTRASEQNGATEIRAQKFVL